MGKGGFRGGYGGAHMGAAGGGVNQNMLRQAQKMREDMLKAQAEVEAQEFTGAAGGGTVTAVVNGRRELLRLTIRPEAVLEAEEQEDVELLQDTVTAAVNDAMAKAGEAMSQGVGKFTGGLI